MSTQQLPPKLQEIREFTKKTELVQAMRQWDAAHKVKPLKVWEAVAVNGTIRQRAEQLGFNYKTLILEVQLGS